MFAIVLTLLGGTAAVALLCMFVLHRHATGIASVRETCDAKRDATLKASRDLDRRLIDELLDGKPCDRAVQAFVKDYGRLLPTGDDDQLWTPEDLAAAHRDWINTGASATNRRLVFPASVGVIVILVATVGLSLVFYNFSSSTSASSPGFSAEPYVPLSPAASSTSLPPLDDLPVLQPSTSSSVDTPQAEPTETPPTPTATSPSDGDSNSADPAHDISENQ